MYLSKLLLNPRSREARRDVSAPYELHRTLAHAFATEPGTDYRAAHGVLFRIEPLAYGSAQPVVLVQSLTKPDWYELPETYLHHEPQMKHLPTEFSVGQTLAFRLVANPTKKEKRPGKQQGRRVALSNVTEDDTPSPAHDWLIRKGEQSGFRLLHTTMDDFWLGTNSRNTGKNSIPIYGVCYDGLLQIIDPVALTDALAKGIGASKGFGFGMLSLARPH